MATKIVTKNSSTASAVPTASDLVQGELAVNVADKRLFTEDNAGAIVELGTNPSGNVTFQDNGKAIFGAGSDLQIYHDGLNSYIVDAGTGDLYFRSASNLYIGNAAGTQSYITAADGGAVDLRYNGAAKLATTSTGIDVIGSVTADGLTVTGTNANLVLGTSGNDITFNRNADNYINASGGTSSNIIINPQNRFVVNTGGSERMRIDSAGNVGIGTSSPAAPLDVVSSSGAVGAYVRGRSSDNIGSLYFTSNSSVSTEYGYVQGRSTDLRIQGFNNGLILQPTSGNVGIGTTAPSAKMHVIGDIATSTRVATDTINGYTGGSTPLTIQTGGAQSIILGTNGSERMRIDSSGQVGIGTSSPSSELTIGADTPQIDLLKTSSADVLANIRAETDAGSGGKLVFQTKRNGNTALDRMTIDDDGNVGIGTSPARQFHLHDSSASYLHLTNGTTGSTANDGASISMAGTSLQISNRENGVLQMYTNGSERMRIDSAGRVGIGVTPSSGIQLEVGNSTNSSAVSRVTNGTVSVDLTASSSGKVFLEVGTNHPLIFATNATERMRIDSSGNLLLGTTSPNGKLTLNSGGPLMASYKSEDTNGGYIYFGSPGGGAGYMGSSYHIVHGTPSDDYFAIRAENGLDFAIGSTRVGRFDSSGNLLVGKTTASIGTVGCELRNDGYILGVNDGDAPLFLNRKSSDGDIAKFYKDGTAVGSISCGNSGAYIYFGSSAESVGLGYGGGFVFPTNGATAGSDNSKDLGSPSYRWDDIYATNGTIQTSDRNEKQDIEELSDAEQRVAVAAKGLLRKFRWKDSVAEKGDEARVHFGIIAQDLQAAFAAEGLDAGDYAMFISTTWTDEETNEEKTRMGVRYSELLAFIIAAL